MLVKPPEKKPYIEISCTVGKTKTAATSVSYGVIELKTFKFDDEDDKPASNPVDTLDKSATLAGAKKPADLSSASTDDTTSIAASSNAKQVVNEGEADDLKSTKENTKLLNPFLICARSTNDTGGTLSVFNYKVQDGTLKSVSRKIDVVGDSVSEHTISFPVFINLKTLHRDQKFILSSADVDNAVRGLGKKVK